MYTTNPMAQDTAAGTAADSIPEREAIPPACTWDVEALYPTPTAWDADLARVPGLIAPIEALRGHLSDPGAALRFFALDTELDMLLDRLYCYAHLKADEDTTHTANQARESYAHVVLSETAAKLSWAVRAPGQPGSGTPSLARALPAMTPYRYTLLRLLRLKAHTLSEPGASSRERDPLRGTW